MGSITYKSQVICNCLQSQPARYSSLCKQFQDLDARWSCSIPIFNYVMNLIDKESEYVENFPNEENMYGAHEDSHGGEEDNKYDDISNPIISQTKGRNKEKRFKI